MKEKVFAKTIQKTEQLLQDLQDELELSRDMEHESYNMLRSVLQTLRDRLTIDEAFDLLSQLPLFLKGTFVDGWKPAGTPKKMGVDEFVAAVERRMERTYAIPTQTIIAAVLRVLKKHVSEGEMKDVQQMLPARFDIFFT